MENDKEQEGKYSEVIDQLINMFGNVLNRDIILAIVDNCEGDRKYS